MSNFFTINNFGKLSGILKIRALFKNYKNSKIQKFVALFFICTIFSSVAFAISFPPKPTNFVNDYTNTLTADTVTNLDAKLKTYEEQTGTEIAVAMIATTEGMDIAEYATELGNAWGVGKKNTDNGALLVIAKDDHNLFIATGSQLEGALPDLTVNDIVNDVIVPQFKAGDFDMGVTNGVDAMLAVIKGESFTDLRMSDAAGGDVGDWMNWIVFAIFFIFPWSAAILGRSKAIWPGAVIGGIGGTIIGLAMSAGLATIALAIFFGFFGLFMDWVVSRNYAAAKKSGHNSSWWAGGGGFGGGGSSSGGFGGFGGGGFSGGGSGGSW